MIQEFLGKLTGGFVLAFHELPVERFVEFVECLAPARPVSLAEIVARRKKNLSTSGLFAITVDDGIADTVRPLARWCRERGWPITFYLPTEYLDTGEGMPFQWWRQLKPLLPPRRFELACGVFDFSRPSEVGRLERVMENLWQTRPSRFYLPDLAALLEAVLKERGLVKASLQPLAPIPWAEAAELARCELISFESHGISHAAVSALNREELERELKDSRDLITERTGRECRHLAYPFGSNVSIGHRAPAAAARLYDSAVTMSLGGVDRRDPWLLPRIPLYPSNSTLEARMKVLLKCRAAAGLNAFAGATA